MTDNSIRKIITQTIDNIPVPWEQLWVIFQRVMQLTQGDTKAIEEKREDQSEYQEKFK